MMSNVKVTCFLLPYKVLARLLIRHCEAEGSPLPVDMKVMGIHVEMPDDQALEQCRVFATSGTFDAVPRGGAIYRLGELSLKEESQVRLVPVPMDADVSIEKPGDGSMTISIKLKSFEEDGVAAWRTE